MAIQPAAPTTSPLQGEGSVCQGFARRHPIPALHHARSGGQAPIGQPLGKGNGARCLRRPTDGKVLPRQRTREQAWLPSKASRPRGSVCEKPPIRGDHPKPHAAKRVGNSVERTLGRGRGGAERNLPLDQPQFHESLQGSAQRCRGLTDSPGDFRHPVSPEADGVQNGPQRYRRRQFLQQKSFRLFVQKSKRVQTLCF